MYKPDMYKKEFILTPGYSTTAGKMSPLTAFSVFQEISAEHMELLDAGVTASARRGFAWLVVHSRVEFEYLPTLMHTLTAETWIERPKPDAIRSYRSYLLREGGEAVARGRIEWVIMGMEGRLRPFSATEIKDTEIFPEESAIPAKLKRFRNDFTEDDLSGTYTVASTDIDLGHHMNNVAYVRLLLSCLSADTIADGSIGAIELHYFSSCYEGEKLKIYLKRETRSCRILISREDGKAAVIGEISFKADAAGALCDRASV